MVDPKKGQPPKAALPIHLINGFINATIEVLQKMAHISQVKRKKMIVEERPSIHGELAGIIGISGKLTGNVAISLNKKLAEIIIGKMLGMKPEEVVDGALNDGIGELINLVTGKAKANLMDKEGVGLFSLSLPTVITGLGQINQKSGTQCILVSFEVEGEELILQLSFSS